VTLVLNAFAGVYETLHWPEDTWHVLGENAPVELEDQVTVPLGAFPVTVAVQSELAATTMGAAQETVVEA
jgi:hypothetical protein